MTEGSSGHYVPTYRQVVNKENCVQLVLDTGQATTKHNINILEYLKTEMVDDKRQELGRTVTLVKSHDTTSESLDAVRGEHKHNDNVINQEASKKSIVVTKEHGVMKNVDQGGSKIQLVSPVRSRKEVTEKEGQQVVGTSRPKNYNCVECNTGFVSSKDLNRHRVVHTGEKPYSCPYCDQKFTAPSSRATHIRSIHEKSQEYLCPDCDKPFNQKSNMVKHYKTIHLETVVITCQECGREFNQASALRRHIKIVHKKELPHACNQCGKKFALAESLKKHTEAIHLKSRAYPCTYCDYAASRADMLKIHIRKIHTKEWSYKCDFCEQSGTPWGCILPKELRRHLQTRHSTEYLAQQELEKRVDQNKSEKRMVSETRSITPPPSEDEKHTIAITNNKPVMEPPAEEKAFQLLTQLKHPLQFSVQLEAEVRAKACRAPPSVLNTVTKNLPEENILIQSTMLVERRQPVTSPLAVKPVQIYTDQSVTHILPDVTQASQSWTYTTNSPSGGHLVNGTSPSTSFTTFRSGTRLEDKWLEGGGGHGTVGGGHTTVLLQGARGQDVGTQGLRVLYEYPRS